MTPAEQQAYLAELERRWRARTPPQSLFDALPGYRVPRSEMRLWFQQQYQRGMDLDEEVAVQPAVTKLMRKLRRQFPGEAW